MIDFSQVFRAREELDNHFYILTNSVTNVVVGTQTSVGHSHEDVLIVDKLGTMQHIALIDLEMPATHVSHMGYLFQVV